MRRLVIVLAALVLVLVAADRAAAYLAAGAVADAVRRDQGLASTPDVDIRGFPFLTQALGGRYDEIDVRLGDVPARQGVRLDAVTVRLRGVHLAAGDAIHGAVSRLPVDDADVQARASFPALAARLQAAAGAAPLQLGLGPGSSADLLAVTGQLPLNGETVPLRGQVRLAVTRGVLTATAVPSSLGDVPARLRRDAARLLSQLTVRLPTLPFGFRASGVEVGADGVTVRATGRSIVLS